MSEPIPETARPPLSVVIGTRHGWPEAQRPIMAIRDEVLALGGEIVVADSSGHRPPSGQDGAPVRWLEQQADSVYALVAIALRAAQGEIVATTEDHAVPRPGWIEAVISAHRRHPEAAVIGGAIENGSPDRLIAWASYFCTKGPYMAPLGRRRLAATNHTNASYKRHAIVAFDDHGGLGFMDLAHDRSLIELGGVLLDDDRMVVDHLEVEGIGHHTALHFHNGRPISGFRRIAGMDRGDWLRVAAALVLPVWRTARFVRVAWAKGRHRRELAASMPWMLWLEYAQGMGHLVGYAAGPGDSPRQMR